MSKLYEKAMSKQKEQDKCKHKFDYSGNPNLYYCGTDFLGYPEPWNKCLKCGKWVKAK